MNQRHTIESLLTNWGQAQRQLPSNHETIKSQTISHLPTSTLGTITKPLGQRRVPWATIAFASLAIITLLINPQQFSPVILTKSGSIPLSGTSDNPGVARESSQFAPITDNREFIKTSYSATLRTRQIEKLTQNIQIIVHGVGGRVDSSTSSPHWGYVSFAIPANQLATFRDQIKDLTSARMYVETTSAQNLLPQKQLIEDQRQQIEVKLQQLRDEQTRVKTDYTHAIALINSQVESDNNQLANIRARLEVTSDYNLRMELIRQQNILLVDKQTLEASLVNKKTIYTNQINTLNAQIRNNEAMLNSNLNEDQQLIDNVATVQGTISLSWISVWEILEIYSPINLIALIFIVVALITYWWHRRRNNQYIDLAF